MYMPDGFNLNEFLTLTVCMNNGELRLSGGSTAMQGRVEICWNGVWGTVCDEQFDSTEAQVVCAQLNYSTSGNNVYKQWNH